MMNKSIEHIVVGSHIDLLYFLGDNFMLGDQVMHQRHSGVGERTGRVRFYRYAGVGKAPG